MLGATESRAGWVLALAAAVAFVWMAPAARAYEMSEIIQLDEYGGMRTDAEIDADGNLHVMWISGSQVYYVKFLLSQWPGVGLVPKADIEPRVPGADNVHWLFCKAQMGVDPGGDAHFVWGDGGFRTTYYQHTENGVWAGVEILQRTTGAYECSNMPDVTVGPDGTVYVATRHGYNLDPEDWWMDVIWKSPGQGWVTDHWVSGPFNVYDPAVLVAPDGTVYATWHSPPNSVGYSYKSGNQWIYVTDDACPQSGWGCFPGWSMQSDGTLHGVYQALNEESWEKDSVWYVSVRTDNVIDRQMIVGPDDVGPHSSFTRIAVNKAGDAVAAWRDNDPLHYAVREAGGDWVSDWVSRYEAWCAAEDQPSPVTDGQDIYLVWSDAGLGLAMIKFSFNAGPKVQVGGWCEDEIIPGVSGEGSLVAYVSDPNGLNDIQSVVAYDLDNPGNMVPMSDVGGGFYSAQFPMSPGTILRKGVMATDSAGAWAIWPALHIEGSPGAAGAGILPPGPRLTLPPHEPTSSIYIPFAGYLESSLDRNSGGTLSLAAYVLDMDGLGVANVEILVGGQPTGVYLARIESIDPNLFAVYIELPPGSLSAVTVDPLIELRPRDMQGGYGQIWPYCVEPMPTATPTATPTTVPPTATPTPTPTVLLPAFHVPVQAGPPGYAFMRDPFSPREGDQTVDLIVGAPAGAIASAVCKFRFPLSMDWSQAELTSLGVTGMSEYWLVTLPTGNLTAGNEVRYYFRGFSPSFPLTFLYGNDTTCNRTESEAEAQAGAYGFTMQPPAD